MGLKIDKTYTGTKHMTKRKNRTIKYIVWHYTASTNSTDKRTAQTALAFRDSDRKASADFVVGDEKVYQCNPDIKNYNSWHCGGSKYSNCASTGGGKMYKTITNANSIGIEIASSKVDKTKAAYTSSAKDWYYTEATLKNAIELTCKLLKEYGLPVSRVYRHFDVVGKECPAMACTSKKNTEYGNKTGDAVWKEFKKMIEKRYDELYGEKKEEAKKEEAKKEEVKKEEVKKEEVKTETATTTVGVYKLKEWMNIRSLPTSSSEIVGKAEVGSYTIVELDGKDNQWGLLKSYADKKNGWICISEKYATKIK